MFEMVAVGAIAMVLELRMPTRITRSRRLGPVEPRGTVEFEPATGLRQHLDRIDWQHAARPQRAFETRITSALCREIDRSGKWRGS